VSDSVSHIIGLDIGKNADPSALVVAERRQWPGMVDYEIRHAKRWKLGTPYTAPPGTPNVTDDVLTLLRSGMLLRPVLVVDATGVGAAVVDLLRWKVDCQFRPVVITGGENSRRDGKTGNTHVPKKDLAGVLQAALGTRRLQFAGGLALLETIKKELAAFRIRVTKSANEAFEAAAGSHDDLVLALAMAVWLGECAFGGEIDNSVASEQGRSLLDAAPPGVWETEESEKDRYSIRGD